MGAPTYMGSLSAPFKAFMDATSHLQYAEKRWAGKIAAGFTNGASRGGDKQNSLVQLMTFAAQHQMHWVNLGLNYGNNRSYTNEDILNRDSYTLGMAGQADMDQGGDVAPPSSDIRSAEFLGRRVAEVAQELSVGRAVLDRPAMRGVSGGADNQDPERRGVAIPEGVGVPSKRVHRLKATGRLLRHLQDSLFENRKTMPVLAFGPPLPLCALKGHPLSG
jgi:hypothetical protein